MRPLNFNYSIYWLHAIKNFIPRLCIQSIWNYHHSIRHGRFSLNSIRVRNYGFRDLFFRIIFYWRSWIRNIRVCKFVASTDWSTRCRLRPLSTWRPASRRVALQSVTSRRVASRRVTYQPTNQPINHRLIDFRDRLVIWNHRHSIPRGRLPIYPRIQTRPFRNLREFVQFRKALHSDWVSEWVSEWVTFRP